MFHNRDHVEGVDKRGLAVSTSSVVDHLTAITQGKMFYFT